MDNDKQMNLIRQLYLRLFENWHPGVFMAFVQVALYFSMHAFQNRPAVTWLAQYSGITFMTPLFWQIAFLAGAFLLMRWGQPRFVLMFSLPAAVYGGVVVWWGYTTHQLPADAMVLVAVAYLSILGVMVMSSVISDFGARNTQLQVRVAELEAALSAKTADTEAQ